jgi:hypothetical protein
MLVSALHDYRHHDNFPRHNQHHDVLLRVNVTFTRRFFSEFRGHIVNVSRYSGTRSPRGRRFSGHQTTREGQPFEADTISPKVSPRKKKRVLSPEGRARIAKAVKRRWAAQKKAVAK